MESNLEKASEMAESLLGESGPDYTGGDDQNKKKRSNSEISKILGYGIFVENN